MRDTLHGIAFSLAALGLSLTACGGGSKESETMPAATAEPAPAAPAAAPQPAGPAHLKFAEMTVSEGARPIFKIHADGKTEVAGQGGAWAEGPEVGPDGTIRFKGQEVARIEADGKMKNLRTGEPIPVTVGTDTLTAQGPGGEMKLQITEDGTIAVPGAPPQKNLKVEGAADAETRRTALALLGAIFLSGSSKSQPSQQQPAPQSAQPGQPAPSGQATQPKPATPAPTAPAPTKPPK